MSEENDFGYEAFAGNPFYTEINRCLVRLTGLEPPCTVVDLGAGTGAVTRLIAEELKCVGDESEIIAVEPSRSALAIARRNLETANGVLVRFVQADAERFSQFVGGPVHAVFFCNAIHLVRKKTVVVREMYRSLQMGGTLSLNTSFFVGAEPPESLPFYRRTMSKALRYLRRRYGLFPDRDQRAVARQPLSREQYIDLLETNGFQVRKNEVVTVPMPLKGFEDISGYSLFIEGALPGIPLDLGKEALQLGVREAFAELGLETSPRNWLLVVAEEK